MEEVSLNWPLEATKLEPLRPLSPEVYELEEVTTLDVNLDKLSRSEIAGKLLDHLDELYHNAEETEPFDWFANEKSIDLPIFENFSIPVQNEAGTAKTEPHYNNFHFDSPEYEPATAPQNYRFDVVPQTQLTYPPRFDASVKMSLCRNGGFVPSVESKTSAMDTEVLKKETLTPPDSPKDDDILKLLQEIVPGDWDKLVETSRVAETSSLSHSENSCSVDEFMDNESSSQSITSESGLDDPDYEEKDFSPVSSSRRSRKRGAKPYSRVSAEERRQRKKEQNKNAATRYRMKKKQEVEEAKTEEKLLEDRNKELQNQVDDISREIKYLKSLMRDLYRKKGLIK